MMTREEGEKWLPIPGFEGDYEASSLGRIRRLTFKSGTCNKVHDVPRIITQHKMPRGYLRVCLSRGGKSKMYLVHRLILLSFKGDGGGKEGAHLNGKCTDNRIENLIWATHEENNGHRYIHGTFFYGEQQNNAKLTADAVRKIRELSANGEPKVSISKKFGVAPSTVSGIVRRCAWKHVI